MEVSQAIENAALSLGCLYLRAIPSDANDYTERTRLGDNTLVIYSNNPAVDVQMDSFLKVSYPVQIQVVKLGSFDDNTVDSDILINSCRATSIQLALNIYSQFEGVTYPPNITIDPFDTIQIMDDILTGVTLIMTIQFPYVCPTP